MNQLAAKLLLVLFIFTANIVFACWAAPPDVVWGTSSNGQFEFKTENKTGHISVYKTGDRANPLWETSVPEFDALFSDFILTDSGDILLHVRGNHQVSRITDTAVHIFRRDGSTAQLDALKFINRLVKTTDNLSVSPEFMWMENVKQVTDEFFTVVNADGVQRITILSDLTWEQPTKLEPSNFQYMLNGYYYAGSRIRDRKALGGFASSANYPKKAKSSTLAPREEVYLLAAPNSVTTFQEKYNGMKLFLVNGTGKRQAFNASDSRLSIIQEAKDENGSWKPLEQLPISWCGNSQHRVFLGAKEYWEFAAPRYEGSLPTTLRFSLRLRDDKVLLSNEFEGSVNPEQFTEEQDYITLN